MLSSLQWQPATPNVVNKGESTIDPSDWKGSFGVDKAYSLSGEGTALFGVPGAPYMRDRTIKSPNAVDKSVTLDKFLTDKDATKKMTSANVMPELVKAMWEKKKKDEGATFTSKYGKDPAYTADVEKRFW